MKKLIFVGLAIAAVSAGGNALASTPHVASTTPGTAAAPTQTGNPLPSVIDDIAVPFDVLVYAQTEFQGYAVSKVSKTVRAGQQIYALRVDQDDVPDDYSSFYLLYDTNWKLIGQEKTIAPPPPPMPRKEDKKDKDRSEEARSAESRESDDDDDEKPHQENRGSRDDEGGRGAGPAPTVSPTTTAPASTQPSTTSPTPPTTSPTPTGT